MNGRVTPTFSPHGSHEASERGGGGDRPSRRFLVALSASLLLHAGVLFLPYLGPHRSKFSVPSSLQKARRPPFEVILTDARNGKPPQFQARAQKTADAPATAISQALPAGSPVSERTEGADFLPIPAPRYYTTDQLTKRPQPLDLADLDPPRTNLIVASGKMVLALRIDEFGTVADVAVEETDLPDIFAATATEAFKRSRFAPGERNGQRVGTLMRIEVTYVDGRTPQQ